VGSPFIGTAYGPLLVSVEVHAVSIGQEDLIVAAVEPVTRVAGGDAAITAKPGTGTRVWFSVPLGGEDDTP
jgi:hypothetical protein